MDLNSREWASLCWLTVLAVWAISIRPVRQSAGTALIHLMTPILLVPLLAMLAWIALEVWIAARFSLWTPALLSDTVVWTVGTAIVLWMKIGDAAKDPAFFRKTLADTVKVAVFVEFFINFYVLGFWWELALQPVIALLSMMSVFAERKAEHRAVKRIVDWLLAASGFAFFGYVAIQLIGNWRSLDPGEVSLTLALPVWLTAGIVPFFWLLSLYVVYDGAFRAISWATNDGRARWRARWAVLREFGLRRHELQSFAPILIRRIAATPTVADARAVIDGVRRERHARERAKREAEERVRLYSGSDEVDADGLRLDRREFEETSRALHSLWLYQTGWFQNQGKRYSPTLLEAFGNDFTSDGLPKESGIELHVAKNGRAWYAWRRTVTGWCFAIGASASPPSRWLYDGPDPPDGFPGQHRSWGSAPQSVDTHKNWKDVTQS